MPACCYILYSSKLDKYYVGSTPDIDRRIIEHKRGKEKFTKTGVTYTILDKVDIIALVQQYPPGGTGSYHPHVLLKILVYAYINNVHSNRKIEEAASQQIHYMWQTATSKRHLVNWFSTE